jgi:hypothetical protein
MAFGRSPSSSSPEPTAVRMSPAWARPAWREPTYWMGLRMGCAWAVHGLCMGCAWVVHGLCMGCAWIHGECVAKRERARAGSHAQHRGVLPGQRRAGTAWGVCAAARATAAHVCARVRRGAHLRVCQPRVGPQLPRGVPLARAQRRHLRVGRRALNGMGRSGMQSMGPGQTSQPLVNCIRSHPLRRIAPSVQIADACRACPMVGLCCGCSLLPPPLSLSRLGTARRQPPNCRGAS